jgi:hypothetical protein
MANNIDQEYEDYLKQQEDAEYEAYKAQQAAPEERDYLAETAMSPEFMQPGIPSPETMAKGMVGAANVADVLGSSARAGMSKMTEGEYLPTLVPKSAEDLLAGPKAVGRFATGAGEQLLKNIKSPLTAPMEAPSMGEIIGKELRTKTIPNILTPESVKRQGETLGGVFSELAMPALEAGAFAKGIQALPKAKTTLDSFLKGSKQSLKAVERKQVENILNKNVLPTQLKNQGFKPEDISAILVEQDLSKYATNTDDMLKALEGSEKAAYETAAPGLLRKQVVSKSPGLIKLKSDAMRSEIVDLARKNNVEVQVPAFSIKQKLLEENAVTDPLSGLRYSPEIVQEREKIINEILKPYEEEWVPGIPLEAARPSFRAEVPPPTPLGQPDLFPMGINEKSVKEPVYPPRPEFGGIEIPELLKAPEDINRMAGVPQTPSRYNIKKQIPAKPIPPQSEAGAISKEAQKKYEKDLASWEKESARAEKEYERQVKLADKADADRISGAEKTRESMAKEAISKQDALVKDWENTVSQIKSEYEQAKKSGRALDSKIMEQKVNQAADRFIEKAKRNEKYRTEIMDADEEYRQHLIESLNRKVFNKPRHWSLEDMLVLRTNLGKRMNSADFYSDKVLPVEKDVVEGLYRSLKKEISSKLEGIPTSIKGPNGVPLMADEYYELQSEALNKMIQAKEILTNAKNKGLKDADLSAKTIAAVTGLGTFGMVSIANMMMGGNVSLPATALGMGAAAAGYGATKAAAPGVLARGAGMARKGIEVAEKYPEEMARVLGTGSRQVRDNYVMENKNKFPKVFGREPQSVNIEDAKIPSTTEGILQNKELVLEKLASLQVSDKIYRAMAYGMNKSPKSLPNVIPLLMMEYPDSFEKEPENDYMLLDGKFIDSNEAAAAADSTSKRTDLSSIEKARIINEINKNKRWIGGK